MSGAHEQAKGNENEKNDRKQHPDTAGHVDTV
jgi:hypothetical protein